MKLRMTTGIPAIMGSIVGAVLGACIAEFFGLQDINKLWVIIPMGIIGAVVGIWREGKLYDK